MNVQKILIRVKVMMDGRNSKVFNCHLEYLNITTWLIKGWMRMQMRAVASTHTHTHARAIVTGHSACAFERDFSSGLSAALQRRYSRPRCRSECMQVFTVRRRRKEKDGSKRPQARLFGRQMAKGSRGCVGE